MGDFRDVLKNFFNFKEEKIEWCVPFFKKSIIDSAIVVIYFMLPSIDYNFNK